MLMKTRIRCSNRASVLLAVLAITAIFTLCAAYYFQSVTQQQRSIIRSQVWNSAMPLADAGVEEALSHLNRNCENGVQGSLPPGALEDGWSIGENSLHITKINSLGDGYYRVVIDFTDVQQPIIYAEGFAPNYLAKKEVGAMMAAINTAQYGAVNKIGGKDVRGFVPRAVWVRTHKYPLFEGALAADGQIDMNGNNVLTDSFDSSDPTRSDNGRYKPNVGASGHVATNGKTINVGNANIKGKVRTGPGGLVNVGANGAVGDLAWHANGNSGIQDGYFSDDMNQQFDPVEPPFTSGMSPLYNAPVSEVRTNGYTWVISTCYCESPVLNCCVPEGEEGTITPILTNFISATFPAYGTYVGTVVTNFGTITNSTHPGNGYEPVVPITETITSSTYPSGSFEGNVVTNTVTYSGSAPPPEGTYVPGSLASTTQKVKGKQTTTYTWREYEYTYEKLVGYSYQTQVYTYDRIIGYQRAHQVPNIEVTSPQNYDMVFDSGNYVVSTLNGKIYIRGNATVLVQNSFSLTGQESITIGPSGSMKLYMAGSDATIAGNGLINRNGNALAFQYYGLPSNTSLKVAGNGGFTGTVYAPSAHLQLSGGGNNTEDFIGAAIVKTAKLNGHFNFHYDEAIGKFGPGNGFRIKEWREVAVNK